MNNMKLETYNYIKKCLEIGHRVQTFYPYSEIKPNDISYVADIRVYKVKEDLESYEYIESYGEPIVEVIPRVPKLLQCGDECVVLDTYETREYLANFACGDLTEKFIGKIHVVTEVHDYCQYMLGGNYFPHYMVAPVPPVTEIKKLFTTKQESVEALCAEIATSVTLMGDAFDEKETVERIMSIINSDLE